MNVVLILSSVRDHRLAPEILERIKPLLPAAWKLDIIDPVEYPLPLLFQRYYEMKDPSPVLQKLHDLFMAADGFILLTAEYNHSIPAPLKNLLDHFTYEYAYKASGIISYSDGPYGGTRAAEHLRNVCTNLKMPPITAQPAITFAARKKSDEEEKTITKSVKNFIAQFEWYMEALKNQRQVGLPVQAK